MIVSVRLVQPPVGARNSELGAALLQVLLISTLISLLAIRFTETARDQIEMTEQFDVRVRAEMAAYSAINEVIFLLLSDSIVQVSLDASENSQPFPDKYSLNRFGSPVRWSKFVTITLQDLNGLLPQMFPQHLLWREFLVNKGLSGEQVSAYLGIFIDAQDADQVNWVTGEPEPFRLPSGHLYPNGYIQNSKLVEWIFSDDPELANELLEVSDAAAPFETNILNSPVLLLRSLLERNVADKIISARSDLNYDATEMSRILPLEIVNEEVFGQNSNRLNLEVIVKVGGTNWREKRTVILAPTSSPPFKIVFSE